MPHCPLTIEYALFMIDRHGSKTLDTLMDYGRSSEEILKTYSAAIDKGYLEESKNPKNPFLTREGRLRISEYYGNDLNGYDED